MKNIHKNGPKALFDAIWVIMPSESSVPRYVWHDLWFSVLIDTTLLVIYMQIVPVKGSEFWFVKIQASFLFQDLWLAATV